MFGDDLLVWWLKKCKHLPSWPFESNVILYLNLLKMLGKKSKDYSPKWWCFLVIYHGRIRKKSPKKHINIFGWLVRWCGKSHGIPVTTKCHSFLKSFWGRSGIFWANEGSEDVASPSQKIVRNSQVPGRSCICVYTPQSPSRLSFECFFSVKTTLLLVREYNQIQVNVILWSAWLMAI